MNNASGRGTGSGCLCFFLGFIWAATVIPVWGVVSLFRETALPIWNGGCLVLLLIGVAGAVKIASCSPDETKYEVASNWNELFASVMSFAFAFILVWFGFRTLVANIFWS